MAAVLEKSFALLQGILPQHSLSRLVHWFMRRRARWLKNLQINVISKVVGINRAEAASEALDSYPDFNSFFTRALKPGARPLAADPAALLCPSDGCISAQGPLQGEIIVQAKGHDYSLATLLADDPAVAALRSGHFWTVYLSPRDYHRVHMPVAATLRRMIYVPGRLFSVSPLTVRRVPGLFARNERVVCIFDTQFGPLAQVLVGAMLVGSMDTVWAGTITPARERRLQRHAYPDGEVRLARGAEMGRFNMGSTVILITPPGTVQAAPELQAGTPVKMGMSLGRIQDAG